MLARSDGLETYKWNLHTGQRSNRIPARIPNIKSARKTTHKHKRQRMERNHIRDKRITTPGSDHVKVENRRERAEKGRTLLERANPEIKRKHEQKDGDGFIVVGSCDRAGYIPRCNADEYGREQTGRFVLHFLGKPTTRSVGYKREDGCAQICRIGRECTKPRSEKHTNVPNVDGEMQRVEQVVNDTAGCH